MSRTIAHHVHFKTVYIFWPSSAKKKVKSSKLTVFMLETLKLSKTLKLSRDDFNVLDNFNVSSIKTAICVVRERKPRWQIV